MIQLFALKFDTEIPSQLHKMEVFVPLQIVVDFVHLLERLLLRKGVRQVQPGAEGQPHRTGSRVLALPLLVSVVTVAVAAGL